VVLAHSIEALLVMLHPLMPQLNEELWHGISGAVPDVFFGGQPKAMRPGW